ncbi:MAG: hypothetical protein JST85_23225 [Acidobacteria bacterium]|nr:hypothetical protein [Acidobacteriota bacterium]
MDVPDNFELVVGRGFYRPVGSVMLKEAIDLVSAALAYAREQGISELLVNISALTGFAPPSLAERYFLIEEWATVAGGKVRLAMVARAEIIDPEKIGVLVALNRGLISNIFETEDEALTWLDSAPN